MAKQRGRKDEELAAEDGIWCWRRWDQTDVRSVDLLHIVRAALPEVARSDPQAVMRLLRDLRHEAHLTSLHLLLHTVAPNAQGYRALLVEQLDNPRLVKSGWYVADGHQTGPALDLSNHSSNDAAREPA